MVEHQVGDPYIPFGHFCRGKGLNLDYEFLLRRPADDRVDRWLHCPVLYKND